MKGAFLNILLPLRIMLHEFNFDFLMTNDEKVDYLLSDPKDRSNFEQAMWDIEENGGERTILLRGKEYIISIPRC